MSDIYTAAAAIAAPIVQNYRTDLTTHDRASFAAAAPGHSFLWAPRRNGTQLVDVWAAPAAGADAQTLLEHFEEARDAASWFDAADRNFGDLQWYLISVDGAGDGRVRRIRTSAARNLVASTLARAESAWRRTRN